MHAIENDGPNIVAAAGVDIAAIDGSGQAVQDHLLSFAVLVCLSETSHSFIVPIGTRRMRDSSRRPFYLGRIADAIDWPAGRPLLYLVIVTVGFRGGWRVHSW